MNEKMAKEILAKHQKLEGEIVDLLDKGDYTEKTAGPVLMMLYAETCNTMDMPFDRAVAYALHVLATIYDVELVKVKTEDVADEDTAGETFH